METEIRTFVEAWRESMVTKDVAAAAALREPSYVAILPDGKALTREQELAHFSAADYPVTGLQIHEVWVRGSGRSATAVFDCRMDYRLKDELKSDSYRYFITLRKRDGQWQARKSRMVRLAALGPKYLADPFRRGYDIARVTTHLGVTARGGARRVKKNVSTWARRKFVPSFQDMAYLPYKPDLDFSLPRSEAPQAGAELPVPPRELWHGYHYMVDGKRDVDTMLSLIAASDFTFNQGDRILDLGCAAGRMIRQLQPLADTCEIWGTDISAEHILWCKRNLTPPFHFATTTKVPHLPFEDRSFHLIYCGSVFTHIDDLADAWLLELRRLLVPGGRLYITISDEHTLALFETERYKDVRYPAWIRRQKVYRDAYRDTKGSFDMFTVGRDHDSQVYYNREYFLRHARSMRYEVLSVTPEAYSFQTAVLLKRT